ncbi:MAG TPA: NUDIX domain-containing protein [Micromonosporaceae bacterium]|jgi:8-oxo-dGTP pyrophosphatase MutT (NUDIX family)
MSGRDQVANVDVFLILVDEDGRLLLGLRGPGVYHGGQWNVVSGKADVGEDVLTAVRREAREEAGLDLAPADLRPAGVVHYFNRQGQPRCGFGFRARHDPLRHGPAINAEPHKCDAMDWFDPAELPSPLEPYTAAVLAAADATDAFTIAGGWPPATGAAPA